jgi:hypothetical protein
VSDRSDQLRRQRDLLREHLAWLEREIAAQETNQGGGEPPRIAPAHFNVSASDADRDAEAILAEFRRSAPAIESQTKRGCILYFAMALGLLGLVVLGIGYYYLKNRK